MDFLKQLGDYGPVLFGIGFITPLVAQSMEAVSWSAPLGLSNTMLGLIVGVSLGMIAKHRRGWL
jgi:ABC-type dipeptide/oligopeptide/nickel transport system permease component